MVRNPFYNPLEKRNAGALERIISMGHRLGLHFDCASYPSSSSKADLAKACEREAAILENFFGVDIDTVSYHRPSPLVLEPNNGLSGRLINTYDKKFRGPIHYLADSQGRWKFGAPDASEPFLRNRPLHILIHPIWWVGGPSAPHDSLMGLIDGIIADTQTELEANCAVFKPKPGDEQ
jgi:hypothetical protein